MCVIRSNAIFAFYPYDERSDQTIGTRHDLEKGL